MEISSMELLTRIGFAALLGAIIGLEREIRGHPAGLRTHALVATGSALFTVTALVDWGDHAAGSVDPTRIAAQVVTGLGFIGAGAILRDGDGVYGLTTAATIWISGALGVASATGNYRLAGGALGIVLVVVVFLRSLRRVLSKVTRATASIDLRYDSGLDTLEVLIKAIEALPANIESMSIASVRSSDEQDVRHAQLALSGRRSDIDRVDALIRYLSDRDEVRSVDLVRPRD